MGAGRPPLSKPVLTKKLPSKFSTKLTKSSGADAPGKISGQVSARAGVKTNHRPSITISSPAKTAKAAPPKPVAKPARRATNAPPAKPSPGSLSTPPIRIFMKPGVVFPTKPMKAKKLSKLRPGMPGSAGAVPPPPPPSPVTTDGKPRKNLAGYGMKDLEYFRALLVAKRRELVGDVSSMEREALRSTTGTNLSNLPLHMADMGTDNYEQEFTLGLVEKDRQLLREINSALAKIQDGRFGICEGTGKPIGRPRLEAQPWSRFSIEYARQMERGMLRR